MISVLRMLILAALLASPFEAADVLQTSGYIVSARTAPFDIRSGDQINFADIAQSSFQNTSEVQDRRPHTFRTNAILVETAGQPVTVTVTLRYASGGVNTSAQPIRSVDYSLGPREYIQINQISHALLGAEARRALGDLSNMQLEFAVKAGNGAVVALTSSVDNGTGDSSLRVD